MPTAARIESIEKAMSASVIEVTVPQKLRSHARGRRDLRCMESLDDLRRQRKVSQRQIKEVTAPEYLAVPEATTASTTTRRPRRGTDGAPDPPEQHAALLLFGEMADHDRQHQRVVGAQESLEHHEHADVPGDQRDVREP